MLLGIYLYLISIVLVPFVQCLKQGQDYYQILGLQKGSNPTDKDIRKQYLQLSKKYHPDKNNENDPAIEEKYLLISEAYEVLSDQELKGLYDQHGQRAFEDGPNNAKQHAQQQQFRGGGGGMEDIINQMFGGGGNPFQQGPRKTNPTLAPIQVTLREFYDGFSRDYKLDLRSTCQTCSGKGGQLSRCNKCNGSGRIIREFVQGHFRQQIQQTCDGCQGVGETLKKVCNKCHGNKVVVKPTDIQVELKRGLERNSRVVLEGKGEQMPGLERGDLLFQFEELPNVGNYGYRRRGINLYKTVTLTLKEALNGNWKLEMLHFNEELSPFVLERKAGSVIGFNEIEIIRGLGMPIYDREHDIFDDEFGDLIIDYNIIMPKGMKNSNDLNLDEL
ncbi:hypothetical protein QEN19_001442 [Hanseniaspora menglaensis]